MRDHSEGTEEEQPAKAERQDVVPEFLICIVSSSMSIIESHVSTSKLTLFPVRVMILR